MHIVQVQLDNIKSHTRSEFRFARGTTNIIGENGAGKTTIIEAIAWVLFDLLDYKKDDFVSRGAKKGSVQVTFEGADQRRYTVYRDTGTGYNVFDEELGVKVADKKEDVSKFLRENLGVEPSTDLELLFRTAIGVPQGTFTAIFLDTAASRKNAFDKLLKVEEYRQGADKLLATARFVDGQVVAAREKIARAEGELARLDAVEAEFKDIAAHLTELTATIATLQKDTAAKQEEAQKFEAEEANITQLRAAFEKLRVQLDRSEILLQQKQLEVEAAQAADERVSAVRADNEAHAGALLALKGLEQQRTERDRAKGELTAVETSLVRLEAEQKNLRGLLEKAESAARELGVLEPQIAQQIELENKREVLRNAQAKAKAYAEQVATIDARLIALRDSYTRTTEELKEADAKSKLAAQADALTRQDVDLTNTLARLRATLEHDEKFQGQIQNGLCPVLSAKCLNLQEGQTLQSFLSSQFEEIRGRIKTAEIRQRELSASLQTAREGSKFLKAADTLRRRQEEITVEGKDLRKERDTAAGLAAGLPQTEADLAETERRLAELRNPRERAESLRGDAGTAARLKQDLAASEQGIVDFAEQKSVLAKALEAFVTLDADWARFSAERDRTAEAHRIFLTNEALALALAQRTAEHEQLKQEDSTLKAGAADAEKVLAEAAEKYDQERHHVVKSELRALENSLAESGARLSITAQRHQELEKELARLKEIRLSMQAEFKEKDRLEKIGEVTKFIRDTLKEAAPRVARNYVYHVSNEANQLFREITGNQTRNLKWTDDYAVVLEEGGHNRPFQSLSGGEQMAAALSIRLALLKQLSDVRMAFFDEPTTNMDEIRRERLAEQISHITDRKTFDQLFVISHDDTFEGYVDNVVTVGDGIKDEPAESDEQAAFALTP